MAWLVDGKTFARKVKNPTHGASKHDSADNPMECPSCGHEFTTNEVMPDWPGLPAGVKFDPSDQELLEHLAEQVGINAASRAHPFINEFIPTLNVEDGICYTHPEKLPGVRQDGSSIHFFHRPARAYTTGTRKRRKVQSSDEEGEIRWHKTGKTRPVVDNGRQMGCKKIMVLYVSAGKKAKPEKTNWVMHQYHLGLQEEEREGELVVSKVFYQTQPRQQMAAAMVAKENIDESEHPTPALIGDWRNDLAVLPSMPVTPLPLTAKVAPQQHKGLLESMSEDVHRLQASLSFAMVEGGKEKAESPMLGEEGGSGTEQVQRKCEGQVPVGMMGIASVGCKPFSGQLTSPGSFDTERVQLKCEDQVPAGIMCIPSVGPEPFSGQVTFPTDIPNIGPEPFSGQMTHPIDIPNVGSEPFFSSLDADLLKLLCSDDMKRLSQGDGGADWKNIAAEVCSSQDISLDKIVLNTPPDLLEFLFNSQGSTADWNEKVKIWSDSQKTEDFNVNDFFQNSQSLQ